MRQLLDQFYSTEHRDFRRLDLFLPDGATNGRLLFFIHGGGWSAGGKGSFHSVMTHFCGLGYVCSSADYRLVPGWRFPAPIEDLRLAMAYVKERAADLGFAPNRVAALGSSAGGHLVAMLATLPDDDNLGVTPELVRRDSRPDAAVCLCSVLTADVTGAHPELPGLWAAFLGTEVAADPIRRRVASPMDRVQGGEPPFLMLVGDQDKLTPIAQHEAMRARLVEHGGRATVIVLPGADHGYGYGVTTPHQQANLKHIAQFLDDVWA